MVITIAVEIQKATEDGWISETHTVTDERHAAETKIAEFVRTLLPQIAALNVVVTSIYVV